MAIHSIQDLTDNHHRFLERSVDNQSVYWLSRIDTQDPFVTESNHQKERYVIPVWSDQAYAKRHLTNDLMAASYEVISMDLHQFVFHFLAQCTYAGLLIGTNWNSDLAGLEIEPDILCAELVKTINKTKWSFSEKLNDLEYCQTLIVRLAQALAYHAIETELSLPDYEGQPVEHYLQTEINKAKSLIQETGLDIDALYPVDTRPNG